MTRSKLLLILPLAGLVLLPATDLTAQEAQPDSALVRAAWLTLRSDLRNCVTAQEMYFADHTTYASSIHDMRETYRASSGVTVVLLTSSGTGHSEIAIDERVPGLVCAIYVGDDIPPPLGRGSEGEVVCRGP